MTTPTHLTELYEATLNSHINLGYCSTGDWIHHHRFAPPSVRYDFTDPFEGKKTTYDDDDLVPESSVDSIKVQLPIVLKSSRSGEKDDEETETRGENREKEEMEGDVKDIRDERADLAQSIISESRGTDSLESDSTHSLQLDCSDLPEAPGSEMNACELELGLGCIARPISPESEEKDVKEKKENLEAIERDHHENIEESHNKGSSSSHSSSLGCFNHEANDYTISLTTASRDHLTDDSIGTCSLADESRETDGSRTGEPESGSADVVLGHESPRRVAMMERVNKERVTQAKQLIVGHIESHEGEEKSSKHTSSAIYPSPQADESFRQHAHSLGSSSSYSHNLDSFEAQVSGPKLFSRERESEELYGSDFSSSERESRLDCIARLVSMRLMDYQIKNKGSSEQRNGEDVKEEMAYRHGEEGSSSSSISCSSPNGSSSQGETLESGNGMTSSGTHKIWSFAERYYIDNIPGLSLNGSLNEDMIDIGSLDVV